MRTILAIGTVLSISAAVPTFSDYATARSTYSRAPIQAGTQHPGLDARGTVLAEGEANGASPGGRDNAT
jgi:hypothetical protein